MYKGIYNMAYMYVQELYRLRNVIRMYSTYICTCLKICVLQYPVLPECPVWADIPVICNSTFHKGSP